MNFCVNGKVIKHIFGFPPLSCLLAVVHWFQQGRCATAVEDVKDCGDDSKVQLWRCRFSGYNQWSWWLEVACLCARWSSTAGTEATMKFITRWLPGVSVRRSVSASKFEKGILHFFWQALMWSLADMSTEPSINIPQRLMCSSLHSHWHLQLASHHQLTVLRVYCATLWYFCLHFCWSNILELIARQSAQFICWAIRVSLISIWLMLAFHW